MAESRTNQNLPPSQKHELPEESIDLNKELRHSVKRASSGIVADMADDAVSMVDDQERQPNMETISDDEGIDDDFRPPSLNSHLVAGPPSKEFMSELQSELTRRGRSLSQGALQVDSSSPEASEMSTQMFALSGDKKPRTLVARGPTSEKSATLPSSPKHRQGSPIPRPEHKQEEVMSSKTDMTPSKTDKKAKTGLSKFKNIKRTLSTRMGKPKSKTKVYQRKGSSMISRDNMSDSEFSAERKPSKLNKRLSRSLSNLDLLSDGYAVVGSAPSTPINDSTEDLYEKFDFRFDKPKNPTESSGYSGHDIETTPGTSATSVTSQPLPQPKPRSQQSVKKPVPKPRQNVPKSASLSPLPPPSARENREMAENVIKNIMRDNPGADKTEIVIQTNYFVAKYCDENGGYLEVGSKMVTLLVPAFALDVPTLIYVQIEESHCFSDLQEGNQIAPIVHCGTPGTKFNSPVILTLFASVENFNYLQVTGLRKENIENQQEEWKDTSQNGGKVISTEDSRHGKCVLMLEHFTGDTVAGKLKNRQHFAEIGFVAFTSSVLSDDMTFDIRIWISSNKQWLRQNVERELRTNNARMLGHHQPTMYLFEDAGDVVLGIKNLHTRWALVTTLDGEQDIHLPIRKLQYDQQAEGIKESHVFRIRPLGEFQPQEAVNFNVAMCQKDDESFGVKLQVHIIPEKKQANIRPGQLQPYRVLRQPAKWKPTKQSLDDLRRSLCTQDKWKVVAAWLHLDLQEIECFPCPVSGMISLLYNRNAESTPDYIQESIREVEKALQRLPSDYNEASQIVKTMLESDARPGSDNATGVIRQPVQVTWKPPKQPVEVNEYHFNPYGYYTLQSNNDQDRESDMMIRQETNRFPIEYESNQGARPKTLKSNLQLVPTEQEWPQADHNCNVSEKRGCLSMRGCEYSRAMMDRRPQFPVPELPEYPYDQPVHPEGATGITDSNLPMMKPSDGDEYDVVAVRELQGQDQNTSEIIQEIARGDRLEPDYMNQLIADDHQKKSNKGYVFPCKKEGM